MKYKIKKEWFVNDYIVHNNHIEIILKNNKYVKVGSTKIDKNCFKKVIKYKWHKDSAGRPTANKIGFLSHLVIGRKDGYVVDHINGDKLDNRLRNLRFATYQQNARNRESRGTEFHKNMKKWRARVTIGNKNIYHGWFNTEHEAKLERIKMIKDYFGEFARL